MTTSMGEQHNVIITVDLRQKGMTWDKHPLDAFSDKELCEYMRVVRRKHVYDDNVNKCFMNDIRMCEKFRRLAFEVMKPAK
jgi:Cu2+-containing amine oxidase